MTSEEILLEKFRHENRMKELKYIRATEEKIFEWRLKLIVEKGNAIRSSDSFKRLKGN